MPDPTFNDSGSITNLDVWVLSKDTGETSRVALEWGRTSELPGSEPQDQWYPNNRHPCRPF